MKLAGNTCCFPNHRHLQSYTFKLIIGWGFAQVKFNIMDDGINLTVIPALIARLEIGFGDSDSLATAEHKLKALK
jgi:hypothetical protein